MHTALALFTAKALTLLGEQISSTVRIRRIRRAGFQKDGRLECTVRRDCRSRSSETGAIRLIQFESTYLNEDCQSEQVHGHLFVIAKPLITI